MKIAVLIPCYNEELTIEKVIKDFQRELPNAEIYVYDNNSTDRTSEIALKNNAIVKKEYRQGKGNVVKSMFRDIDADCYIMIDGDDTYPAEFVHEMIKHVESGQADMVIGDRLSNGTYKSENKRPFHNLGNNLVKFLINKIFESEINDIMTGYRVFSKNFVKNIPIASGGFEIETEMSIHALDKKFLLKEVPIDYRDRPEGSFSKLDTVGDGMKVLKTILKLFKDYKPFLFFTLISSILTLMGLVVGVPVVVEFIKTSYITKLPSAVLAVGFILLASSFFTIGLILDTVVKQNNYMYEFMMKRFDINERA